MSAKTTTSKLAAWTLGLLAASGAAALGGLVGWNARGDAPASGAAASNAVAAGANVADEALAEILDRLDLEAASRIELATRLAALELRLDALGAVAADSRAAPGAPTPVGPVAAHGGARPPNATPGWNGNPLGRVDVDTLVSAGFPRAKAEDVRQRLDEVDLERLYLRDRATREGWIEEPRFAQESRALGDGLGQIREEHGDALYDWVLYSSGRPNRVVVDDVMAGSAAFDVGLRAGDVVIRYDGGQLFRPGELRDATQLGRAGESVAVEVEREGETLRLFIPRGPLGVRIRSDRREPPPAG